MANGGSSRDPNDLDRMMWDFEKRLTELEKMVPTLISRMDTNTQITYELKEIVIKGNQEAMEFMRSVIGHEQNMDVVKQQLKTEAQKSEWEMKRATIEREEEFRIKKDEWERTLKAENDKWKREQKEKNSEVIRSAVTKFMLIAVPLLTALVTFIVKFLEGL